MPIIPNKAQAQIMNHNWKVISRSPDSSMSSDYQFQQKRRTLLENLVEELNQQGMTDPHLLEGLAWMVIWIEAIYTPKMNEYTDLMFKLTPDKFIWINNGVVKP